MYEEENARVQFSSLPYNVLKLFQKFPSLDSTHFSSGFKSKQLRMIFL